jgi:hypothetical protein
MMSPKRHDEYHRLASFLTSRRTPDPSSSLYPNSFGCAVQDCGQQVPDLAHQGGYVDMASVIASALARRIFRGFLADQKR